MTGKIQTAKPGMNDTYTINKDAFEVLIELINPNVEPYIMFGPDGEVTIEWERKEHLLEINIKKDGVMTAGYSNLKTNEDWSPDVLLGGVELCKYLKRF